MRIEFKEKVIQCYSKVIIGITFGNYFLSVSKESDELVWLYFIFFLITHLFMKKQIVKFLNITTMQKFKKNGKR